MIDNDKTLPFSLGNLRESMFENIYCKSVFGVDSQDINNLTEIGSYKASDKTHMDDIDVK